MPIVNVSMLEGRSKETKEKIAKEITDTMTRHCGSAPEHIYIVFEDVPKENWAVSGKLFSTIEKEQKEEK